jgi:poly-beta-1,6-N-acetyl-D-glucosamine synthase
MSADRRLLVITPCRDEQRYVSAAIASIAAQSLLPTRWVIVDDGSTDGTTEILQEASSRLDFVRLVRREDRGRRHVGPGVVEAFYAGLAGEDLDEYAFIAKVDLDLELPPDYFQILIDRMLAEPRLGSCSGKPYGRRPDGGLEVEPCGDEMSVGMTKLWKTACFRQIGGLVRGVMWDGIDCHRARMLGWKVRSWDEPKLRFVHARAEGSSQQGILTGRVRHGRGQYFMGTGPMYMLSSAVYRMFARPFVVGGLAMAWGWCLAWLTRQPRYKAPNFRRFLRRYQLACLLEGKRRATERFEADGEASWNPDSQPLELAWERTS